MRSTVRRLALLLAAIPLLLPPTAAAVSRPWPVAPDGARVGDAANTAVIALQKVVGGLSKPVFATHAGDGSGRLFIVEKVGRIRVVRNGSLLATPFLSITSSVSTGSEQGLLGLAFHPSFETNRKLYVDYTDRNGDTVIREYRTFAGNPDAVDKSTGRTVLRIDQPYSNHNGGMLAFGRDGYLYIGMGDGGSAGDPGNRAQSTSSLLGKILRINVNGSTSTRGYLIPSTNPYVGRTGRDEIWSRGLRNPWRFSFDRVTGNLWIGDVGQAKWEEIDRSTRVSSGAGRGANYGWRVMEGRHCYRPSTGCNTSGKHLPLVEYQHLSGRCAVTGGYVYRGSAVPGLYGGYVYGDYCTGEIWIVNSTASSPATGTRRLNTALLISSFGEDEAGELYVCDLNGSVYRVVGG